MHATKNTNQIKQMYTIDMKLSDANLLKCALMCKPYGFTVLTVSTSTQQF